MATWLTVSWLCFLGLDLSLIPAGMTGNTKYFARISAWLDEPAASATTRYHGPWRIANPEEISVTQPPVASQPQEGQPNLQTSRRGLCSAGGGERRTGTARWAPGSRAPSPTTWTQSSPSPSAHAVQSGEHRGAGQAHSVGTRGGTTQWSRAQLPVSPPLNSFWAWATLCNSHGFSKEG